MASSIPLILTLSSWTEDRLRAVLEAKTKSAFDTALDAFLAPHARVTLNGETVSREHYAAQLWKEHTNERSVTVNFNGVVEVPKSDPKAIIATGDVGVFFQATIKRENSKVRPPILTTDILRASLQLVIEQPTDQPKDVDKRRVTSLTQLSAEEVLHPTPRD